MLAVNPLDGRASFLDPSGMPAQRGLLTGSL
jgi:hypothetical protein